MKTALDELTEFCNKHEHFGIWLDDDTRKNYPNGMGAIEMAIYAISYGYVEDEDENELRRLLALAKTEKEVKK